MSFYITIDGGTTNTRISLVKDTKVIDRLNFRIGSKSSIENSALLKETIKNAVNQILLNNGLKTSDIVRILAAGMITSEFGLFKLEHITLPAGIKKLHDSMVETALKDISDIPFVFIRGVKTECNNLESADMMRGEETELIGIMEKSDGKCTYILPGSHSKIIKTDENGQIIEFTTMLTGEMFAALSQNTILKDAVILKNSDLDDEYLLLGFEFCQKNGINKSLFKVRILKNIFKENINRVYSFFLGVILCEEVLEIIKQCPKKVIIGGQKQLKIATYKILKNKLSSNVVLIPSEKVDIAPSIGMVKIYEYNSGLRS